MAENPKHETLEGVESDKSLEEKHKVIPRGIHRRSNTHADRPSEKDLNFIQQLYGKINAVLLFMITWFLITFREEFTSW